MPIRKVLLIVPPALTLKEPRDIDPLPPLGLGYLASITEELGIEVKILDAMIQHWDNEIEVDDLLIKVGLSYEDLKESIAKFNPDLVGVNCQFSRQYRVYHDVFRLVKEVNPEIITVSGGPHASVCPEEVLADPNCDFLLIGEAEDTFKELVMAMDRGGGISEIDGIGKRNGNKIFIRPKTKWIQDLDRVPFPAFHLMEMERYFGLTKSHGWRNKDRFMPIITSRGCPAKCTFCSAMAVWGSRFRTRSVDNVIEEMKVLRSEYNIDEIMFEDDNVTADPKRAKELFRRMIKERLNLIWDTPNGVGAWSIDTEMLDLMKEAGCMRLNFPVESGSQEVLSKIIKKPLKLSKIRELIDHCKKIQLEYSMFLVIGMPGETIDDMWKSFRFAADCGCFKPHISVATPYPGTHLFKICEHNNYFSREFSLDDLFIRSFLIQTPDWDENTLRKVLVKGEAYLLLRNIVSNPFELFHFVQRQIRNPRRFLSTLSRFF